ncbi:MAG: 1-(5-phosphoribosyl)-5-[(5-phosphoribosylamino)methylideneamino]imidazole-4-carboxamide isomerase [Pseudomonadota bacterium]|jgi:phosphoribosylformimino-5-aminoimidazole carboxamide ribotide isomerase
MLLIPAIDLKDGQCVRLQQGDMEKSTVFSQNPSSMALKWQRMGAKALHLVDLNGAFAGSPQNKEAILEILGALEEADEYIPVQLGGGIRDLKTIEYWLDMGIHSVIIGTAAVKDPIFLKEACQVFAGHIMVGIDAKDGMVATDGWAKVSKYSVIDIAQRFEDYGVNSIIYTDIGRDGMLQGINIESTLKLAQSVNVPIIASGGLASIDDIEQLCELESEGIAGVICGKAIYTGAIDFEQAQQMVDEVYGNESLAQIYGI